MRKVSVFRRVLALTRAVVAVVKAIPQLSSVDNRGGWWPVIRESFAGAWQQNITVDTTTVLSFHALYACLALISGDISKLRVRVVTLDGDGIWVEKDNPSYSPVLRKPNHFQTRIQFFMCWVLSKLIHGNTYVLKGRNKARKVETMQILDPTHVWPLVAPNGDVYYKLSKDDLAGVRESVDASDVIVPASEIIHDRHTPLFHPLVGVSPIRACGISALQGLKILENSTLLFSNGAQPGGILTAPGHIPTDTAERIKARWETDYGGDNVGKVAVLGDGLEFKPMAMNAVDAQLIEQLKLTAEHVCSAFLVPRYMVGVGPEPSTNSVEIRNQLYYSQCLQTHIESIEALLDEGLGMHVDGEPLVIGTEFDLDDLIRMDTMTRVRAGVESAKGSLLKLNESRRRFMNAGPVMGGDDIWMQQQMFSLRALVERDQAKPFIKPTPAPKVPAAPPGEPVDDGTKMFERGSFVKAFEDELAAA